MGDDSAASTHLRDQRIGHPAPVEAGLAPVADGREGPPGQAGAGRSDRRRRAAGRNCAALAGNRWSRAVSSAIEALRYSSMRNPSRASRIAGSMRVFQELTEPAVGFREARDAAGYSRGEGPVWLFTSRPSAPTNMVGVEAPGAVPEIEAVRRPVPRRRAGTRRRQGFPPPDGPRQGRTPPPRWRRSRCRLAAGYRGRSRSPGDGRTPPWRGAPVMRERPSSGQSSGMPAVYSWPASGAPRRQRRQKAELDGSRRTRTSTGERTGG